MSTTAHKTWTLADNRTGVYLDALSLGEKELGVAGCSVTKRTLQDGRRRGVDVIEVNNGRLSFIVVPTRGMGIWRAEIGELKLRWQSPVQGPVHPSMVRLWEPSGIGWLDGFDEWFTRCGLESNGAPEFNANGTLRYPLHGRIANTPAHKVEVRFDPHSGELAVVGEVDEARLFGNNLRLTVTVSTRLGQPWLKVTDVVSNLASSDSELELLYHINFGAPLLSPGATVMLPASRIVPRNDAAAGNLADWNVYGPETPGAPEVVYFAELLTDAAGATQALLCAANGRQGVRLKFNKRQLPRFILWKNRLPTSDGYVTGLEPAINYPNPKSFEKEKGRVDILSPGDSRTYEITVEGLTDESALRAAASEVTQLQGDTPIELVRQGDPDWSCDA